VELYVNVIDSPRVRIAPTLANELPGTWDNKTLLDAVSESIKLITALFEGERLRIVRVSYLEIEGGAIELIVQSAVPFQMSDPVVGVKIGVTPVVPSVEFVVLHSMNKSPI
jgi:hypothetical protein